eukprot:3849151-Amphidinium_carterae.1
MSFCMCLAARVEIGPWKIWVQGARGFSFCIVLTVPHGVLLSLAFAAASKWAWVPFFPMTESLFRNVVPEIGISKCEAVDARWRQRA